ncbi:MAG: lipopolysaccharide transport periplasmic protein LptA [Desulfobacterales bacterium]
MRIYPCKCSIGRILTFIFLFWVGGWSWATAQVGKSATPAQPITITADQLVSDDTSKTAEFSGNVKVVRGEYTLTADRLVVSYKKGEPAAAPNSMGRTNIREVAAEGNVRIFSTELTAAAQRAVYDAGERTLVLSGDASTVTSGAASVSGARITLFLDTARFEVSGGPAERVRGVFERPGN